MKYHSEYIFPILLFAKQHEPGTTPNSYHLNSVFPKTRGNSDIRIYLFFFRLKKPIYLRTSSRKVSNDS